MQERHPGPFVDVDSPLHAPHSQDFPLIIPDNQDEGLLDVNLWGTRDTVPSEVEMSPPCMPEDQIRDSITILPDTQPWNEGIYIGFTDAPKDIVEHHINRFDLNRRKNQTLDVEPAPSHLDEIVLSYPLDLSGPSIALSNADLERLNPGTFLNDSLIEFGLKLSLGDSETSNPELVNQTYVFNSFFYQKLTEKALNTSYESIQKWTKNIDIFQKRCIVVPINDRLHWYLAIIYEPEHVITPPMSQPRNDEHGTLIFTFDSLGSPNRRAHETLSAYLRMEAKHRVGANVTGKIEAKAVQVPRQTNSFDCGIYLLHFARTFIMDPKKYANLILSQTKSIEGTERRAIWRVDKNFESDGRKQLRIRIEALSNDWKKARDTRKPLKQVDDESEGDVEFV